MKYIWHGHSCVEMIFQDNTRIIIDPFLTGNPLADISADEVVCDYILLTHGHNDHVGDTKEIALRNNATLICNPEIAHYFAQFNIKAHTMNIGGEYDFGFATILMTPAIHSSSYIDENNQLIPMGLAGGFLIKAEGYNLYHAGDTALFQDMHLLSEEGRVHVAFLPVGGNYTMGLKAAFKAFCFLQCKKLVPIHYNTFEVIQMDPQILNEWLPANVLQILAPGEIISLE